MSPCLIEEGSLSPTLEFDELSIVAGFSTEEFEDQIAEQLVEAHQLRPIQCWQISDIGAVVLEAAEYLAPFAWDNFDNDLMKQLTMLAVGVAKQIIPFYRRDF